MNRKIKRTLSLVLAMLMLVSMLSVYSFADIRVDDYYDEIVLDSVIVNSAWTNVKEGDTVSYVFRGKTITEPYDSSIHFSSFDAAWDYFEENNINSRVVILAPGVYTGTFDIKGSVTILGSHAGMNPNVQSDNVDEPWQLSDERGTDESIIRGVLKVNKRAENTTVTIDGVTFRSGGAFVDKETKSDACISTLNVKNVILDNPGNATVNGAAVPDVFNFESEASKHNVIVNISDVYARNVSSSSMVGGYITDLTIERLFYTESAMPAVDQLTSHEGQPQNTTVTDSCFYNNNISASIISFDTTIKDSVQRTSTQATIEDNAFLNSNGNNTSPISIALTGTKNKINITNNYFISGSANNTNVCNATASAGVAAGLNLSGCITVSGNKLKGLNVMPNTDGYHVDTRWDFTGNYFYDDNGLVEPVYPSSGSMTNIKIDYFWLDSAMKVKSSEVYLKSTGIPGVEINNVSRIMSTSLDYGTNVTPKFQAQGSKTTYKMYSDAQFTNEVKNIDTRDLESGEGKNTFYIVGSSSLFPSYQIVYTLTVSTYNPALAIDFNNYSLDNTYALYPAAASMNSGEVLYRTWDGVSYKFTVGVNVFATVDQIIKTAGEAVPNIIMFPGEYSGDIQITGSVNIMGAKNGINPNVTQFESPELAWPLNPDRSNADEETVLTNGVMYITPDTVDATVTVDGITLGKLSAFADRGTNTVTHTNVNLKNIIIDGAGGVNSYTYNGTTETLTAILNFANASGYADNHKTINMQNIRMENQGTYVFFDSYFETMVIDGLYYANNTRQIHNVEWSAPTGQNLYLEIRNSHFYMNNTSTYLLILNANVTNTAAREYSRFVIDHNMFYNTSTNANGIFGYRYANSRSSLKVTNNIAVTQTANCFMPGNENWFLGSSSTEVTDDVVIKYNRFARCNKMIDMETNVYEEAEGGLKTIWDYNDNFFQSSYDKSGTGSEILYFTGQEMKAVCDRYFLDWDMKVRNTDTEEDLSTLTYSFTPGKGTVDTEAMTYTDSVGDAVNTYTFDIELPTHSKYAVYSDSACTRQVSEPLTLSGGTNTFYIKLSSYNNVNSDIYTATITKPTRSGAEIVKFGSWRVGESGVYAATDIGETRFAFPTIEVSPGATFAIYNDQACTQEYTLNYIENVTTVPQVKYIKVESEDGTNTKIYTFSVLQAENDQAELTAIEGATKTGTNTFEVSIPMDANSFEIIPEYSSGATLKVISDGIEQPLNSQGTVTVGNIDARNGKTVTFEVTSQTGLTKTFTLLITKDRSSTDIKSIDNALLYGDGNNDTFTARTSLSVFDVNVTLSNPNASYKLYSDAACTSEISGSQIMLSPDLTTVYIKVTSEDGMFTKIYSLVIESTAFGMNAIFIENGISTSANVYTVTLPDNLTETVLNITPVAEDATYKLYADDELKIEIPADEAIKLDQKTTHVYLELTLASGTKTTHRIDIVSNRSAVSYKDQGKIASWAKDKVDYLNNNGYGILVGDENQNFNPTSNMTRFEIAVVASKLMGIDVSRFSNVLIPFTDSIPNWASNYVKAMFNFGIMSGMTSTSFGGTEPTQRQQFARIMVETIFQLTGQTENVLTYYNTNQSTIDSQYEQLNFADEDTVQSWAKPYVRIAVVEYGIISGVQNGNTLYIEGNTPITRQQVAVILALYLGFED